MKTKGQLRDTLRKLDALAKDKGATEGERAAARRKADEFRVKLGEGPFDAAAWSAEVERGKQLWRTLDRSQWELGELALNVGKKYGEAKLQKYAQEIGAPLQTLIDCRTTWNAWIEEITRQRVISKTSDITINYGIARALNPPPNRFDIIRRSPDLTREGARIIMRGWKHPKGRKQTTKQLVASAIRTINTLRNEKVEKALQAVSAHELTKEQGQSIQSAIDDITVWLGDLWVPNNVVPSKRKGQS